LGVFTPKAAALFVATGLGLFFYFQHEKIKLLEERRRQLETKKIGRAHVGGPFSLLTHTNKTFSENDLVGNWSFLYFGFTNCPDICPAELDKITAVVDALEKRHGENFQPIFISVDPVRDPPPQIARYLSDFHPKFIGLTGSYESTKAICKSYRVYFSTPPNTTAADDYLVDHSIFVYLIDPHGEFVEAFGQAAEIDDVVERVDQELREWEKQYRRKT